MPRKIVFELPCRAYGQMRARHRSIKTKSGQVFAMAYKATKQREREQDMQVLLQPHVPVEMFSEPVRVEITVMLCGSKNWPKKVWAKNLYQPHCSKPDVDNIAKDVLDNMTKMGFWRDDALVWSLKCSKIWGDTDCIGVEVIPYQEDEVNIELAAIDINAGDYGNGV